MGSLSMGTGVPGEGSGFEYEWEAPGLLGVRSCDRLFSRSEGRRRREGDSRKTWRWSRLGDEASGRWGRDMVPLECC